MTTGTKRIVLWVALTAFIVLAGCQQETTPAETPEDSSRKPPAPPDASTPVEAAPSVAPQDRAFLISAAEQAIGVVEASRIVGERAQDPDLKALANNMREAQSAANDALQRFATPRQIELPTRSSDEQRQRVRHLRQGGEPERAFLEQFALEGQRATIALYEEQARTGADARIKAFAAESLPVLQRQLALAEQIQRADKP